MQGLQFNVFVIVLCITPGLICADLSIVQYWNGVANKNKKATLAVRANSEIEECLWTNLETDEEYKDGKKKNGVQVKISEFEKGDKKKTLCKLEIDKVKEDDHAGEWVVEIEGKCREKLSSKRRTRGRATFRSVEATERIGRKKRDTNSSTPVLISNIRSSIVGGSQIESLSGRSGIQFQATSRKSNRQSKSNCKAEIEPIKLEVADDDKDLLLLAAMEGDGLEEVFPDLDGNWGIQENKKTILSTRSNQMPDECIVLFDGDEIVQVEKKAKKNEDECDKFEKAKVCISKYADTKSGVYACQLSIEDMNEDLVGTWEVEVKAGKEEGSVEFEVEMLESSGDCEVEEGEPSLANAKDDELTVCTDDEEGDEITIEVEFESNPKPSKVEWEMRRKNKKQKKVKLDAGKKKSGFEADEEEEDDDIDGRYLAAITFELEDEDLDEEENFQLTVKNKEGESEFLITIDSGRRCEPTQEIGQGCEGGGGNDVCDIEDKDCRCNKRETECCDASRRCKENCCKKCTKDEKDDDECELCDKNDRKCMIAEDSGGKGGETCDPEDDKDCRCDDEGKGDNCCDSSKKCKGKNCCKKCDKDEKKDDDICKYCDDRGSKCMKFTDGELGGVYGKAVKVLLESCINLGGTLLKQWTPEGEKRDSKSEREFKKDMEDFYETAKCTRFDDDIQEFYEDGDKKTKKRGSFRAQDRTISNNGGGTISFQNTALRNKVAKVASASDKTPTNSNLKDILGFAADVVSLSKNSSD